MKCKQHPAFIGTFTDQHLQQLENCPNSTYAIASEGVIQYKKVRKFDERFYEDTHQANIFKLYIKNNSIYTFVLMEAINPVKQGFKLKLNAGKKHHEAYFEDILELFSNKEGALEFSILKFTEKFKTTIPLKAPLSTLLFKKANIEIYKNAAISYILGRSLFHKLPKDITNHICSFIENKISNLIVNNEAKKSAENALKTSVF